MGMMRNSGHLPKEMAIYKAVLELYEEGADLNSITVADITKKAGIGKGTAYEYFSDKEEMIAKALFYNGEKFCEQVYEGIRKEKSLYDKFNYLLLTMEEQLTRTTCILRMILLSGNSAMGKRVRELFEQKAASGEIMGIDIAGRLLRDEFSEKEAPSEEIIKYLVISVYSKIFCFSMLLNEGVFHQNGEREIMRKLVIQGICREIEENSVML
ncbi:MAG: TetR/AcrR family transcriptional regulator [Blautia sp.]|nr:TetR/AcrR family transcriptional regulator [Lachnoclostridium sp.]MCM1210231.1 TetR/AcrR family transcriptional regulator [Blautia sp.]